MNAVFEIEKDYDKIRAVIEDCDSTFLVGITKRDNYLEILSKMQHNAIVIVARDEIGETLGYASMYANDFVRRTAFISMYGIKKEFQGNHLGKSLMDKCVGIARRNGMNRIMLEVLNINTKGLAFYTYYGFTIHDQTENGILLIYTL